MQKKKKIVQSGSPLKISEKPLFHFRAFIIGLTLSNFSNSLSSDSILKCYKRIF